MSRHTAGWRWDYKKAKWTGAGYTSCLSNRVPRQIFSLTHYHPSVVRLLWMLMQIYRFYQQQESQNWFRIKMSSQAYFFPLQIMLDFTLWLTFDLQIPKISNLKPSRGPVSGGTIVNITGSHLDAGSNVSVMFKDQPCTYLRSAVKHTTAAKTSNTSLLQ